jgi:hypothetical protein
MREYFEQTRLLDPREYRFTPAPASAPVPNPLAAAEHNVNYEPRSLSSTTT